MFFESMIFYLFRGVEKLLMRSDAELVKNNLKPLDNQMRNVENHKLPLSKLGSSKLQRKLKLSLGGLTYRLASV